MDAAETASREDFDAGEMREDHRAGYRGTAVDWLGAVGLWIC